MRTFRSARGGHTLMEMMVVVAIVGIVAVGAAQLLTKMQEFFWQTNARIALQRDIRNSLNLIHTSLRKAQADTVSLTQDEGAPPYSRINFVNEEGDAVAFRQSGHSLYQDVADPDIRTTLVAKDVEYLAFTYPQTDDNTVVSVSITVKKATYRRNATSLQMSISKVRLMN